MEERVDRNRGLLTLILIVVVVAGAVAWLLRRPDSRALEVVPPPQPGKPSERVLKVYVAGEVVSPGVYTLHEGDRVDDAVAAAGGMTESADHSRVNLAARVQDQQQINVPRVGPTKGGEVSAPIAERAPAPSAPVGQVKVNLNTATISELDALPGIGPVTIQKILNYRAQVGSFKTIDELKDAKLVTNAQFEQIKDRVTVP